jgi:hypothetical protein
VRASGRGHSCSLGAAGTERRSAFRPSERTGGSADLPFRARLVAPSTLAAARRTGQSAQVSEPEQILRCECGRYDVGDREGTGEFHFRVLSVHKDANADGSLEVIGNLRWGVLSPGQRFHLVRSDGAVVPITTLQVQTPASGAARRKGQRQLTVVTPEPQAFHANGCIRPTSA